MVDQLIMNWLSLMPVALLVYYWANIRSSREKELEQENAVLAENLCLAVEVVEQYAPKPGCVLVVGFCREGCTPHLEHLPDHAGVWECSACNYPNAENDLYLVEVSESDELKELRSMGLNLSTENESVYGGN